MIETTRNYSAGSKTRSRHLRRDIRTSLGTSADPLPDVLDVLAAARALGALLDNASGGRYGISIHVFNDSEAALIGRSVPTGTAIEQVADARHEESKNRFLSDHVAVIPVVVPAPRA